jgi:hypothetical protein
MVMITTANRTTLDAMEIAADAQVLALSSAVQKMIRNVLVAIAARVTTLDSTATR